MGWWMVEVESAKEASGGGWQRGEACGGRGSDGAHRGRQLARHRAQEAAERHLALRTAVAGGKAEPAPDRVTTVLDLVMEARQRKQPAREAGREREMTSTGLEGAGVRAA